MLSPRRHARHAAWGGDMDDQLETLGLAILALVVVILLEIKSRAQRK
jgi:hypothetical protein